MQVLELSGREGRLNVNMWTLRCFVSLSSINLYLSYV